MKRLAYWWRPKISLRCFYKFLLLVQRYNYIVIWIGKCAPSTFILLHSAKPGSSVDNWLHLYTLYASSCSSWRRTLSKVFLSFFFFLSNLKENFVKCNLLNMYFDSDDKIRWLLYIARANILNKDIMKTESLKPYHKGHNCKVSCVGNQMLFCTKWNAVHCYLYKKLMVRKTENDIIFCNALRAMMVYREKTTTLIRRKPWCVSVLLMFVYNTPWVVLQKRVLFQNT